MNDKGNKLFIIRGKADGKNVKFDPKDKQTVLDVCFNPTEYSIDKTNVFSMAAIPGLESPIIQYSRGNARTLSIELLLDTYTYNGKKDVHKQYISKLETFLSIDGEIHAPPPCKIVWGLLEFVGVLQDMRKRYVLFLDDGTPVRARVTLTWKEYVPVDIQIKTTPRSSPDRRKIHTLKEGDSLWFIAYRAYGEPRYWKVLAEANNIDDPRRLEPGKQIVIPPLKKGSEIQSAG